MRALVAPPRLRVRNEHAKPGQSAPRRVRRLIQEQGRDPCEVASLNRCKFAAALRFPGVSLGGGDLLVEGVWVGLSVFDSVEVLAVELGERRAV